MKQTAVEWLYEALWKQTDFSLPNNILEKAKELEKQQIIDASNNSYLNSDLIKRSSQNKKVNSIGEQYYNEIFKKKKDYD